MNRETIVYNLRQVIKVISKMSDEQIINIQQEGYFENTFLCQMVWLRELNVWQQRKVEIVMKQTDVVD